MKVRVKAYERARGMKVGCRDEKLFCRGKSKKCRGEGRKRIGTSSFFVYRRKIVERKIETEGKKI